MRGGSKTIMCLNRVISYKYTFVIMSYRLINYRVFEGISLTDILTDSEITAVFIL